MKHNVADVVIESETGFFYPVYFLSLPKILQHMKNTPQGLKMISERETLKKK